MSYVNFVINSTGKTHTSTVSYKRKDQYVAVHIRHSRLYNGQMRKMGIRDALKLTENGVLI